MLSYSQLFKVKFQFIINDPMQYKDTFLLQNRLVDPRFKNALNWDKG